MKRGTNDADGLGKSLLPGHSERNYRVFQQTVQPATPRLTNPPLWYKLKQKARRRLVPAIA
jgi:hypothetical protein